jgi:ABC-type glycerol-3-phosphate transport system substrate-binding protein
MSALGKDAAENSKEGFSILEQVYNEFEKIAQYHPLDQYVKAKNDKDLSENNILFVYNPSWISLIWQAKFPEGEKKMHPCEMPSFGNGKSSSYSGKYNAVFVIPKNAKNKDGTIKLMKFICSSETAEKWVKYSKCPTGLKHKEIYSDFSKSETNLFSQHIKTKYNDNLVEVNLTKVLFNSNKNINFSNFALQIMRGEITAREALVKVKQQLAQK